MDIETQERVAALYWDIRKRAEEDQEYIRLREITEELEERYEALVGQMVEPSRNVLDLYITARETLNRRLLEMACEEIVLHDDTPTP